MASSESQPRAPRRHTAERTPAHRLAPGAPGRVPRLGGLSVLAVLGLCLLGPGLGAASAASGPHPVPPSPGVRWAWGVESNVSFSVAYVGAYNSSAPGLGGNLTVNGAAVAFSATATLTYAAYAVVQVQSSGNGSLSLEVAAAQYRGLSAQESIAGSLPVAGTYAPNTTPPLANQSASVALHEEVLDEARAFLNYTIGPNGSVALNDEHLQYARAVNLSLSAVHFPNVTAAPGGGYTLKYVSGTIGAQGYEAINLTGIFSPGLLLVNAPLTNGSRWTSVSNVTWNGTVAYASAMEASVPGGNSARTVQAASAHLVRHSQLVLNATVNGTRTIVLGNGSAQTDFVVDYTVSSVGGGASVVDGLYLLPSANATSSSTGLVQVVPVRAATEPVRSQAGPATRALVPVHRTMPTGTEATPSGGSVITALPMDPNDAQRAMTHLGTPTPPGPTTRSGFGVFAVILAVPAVVVGAIALRREIRRK